MRLIYVNMLHNNVEHNHVNMLLQICCMSILNIFHVDINKSNVNIRVIMLHVDIKYLACVGPKNATVIMISRDITMLHVNLIMLHVHMSTCKMILSTCNII